MPVRAAKIVMTLSLAAFALLVGITNITDYGANYAFVQHVLSMDTTFPGDPERWRAITAPRLWALGYGAIIAGEILTGLLLLAGGLAMLAAIRAPGPNFAKAKALVALGAALGFVVWFLGFMVVGGEWFEMWQSQTWNGQQAAFRFYATILLVLIFVNQPDV